MTTTPCRLSRSEIEKLAEEFAQNLGYSTGLSLRRLIEGLGQQVTFANIEDHPESLVVQPDGRFEIFLPMHTSAARDQFTMAHELGHYFLHHELKNEVVRYNRSGSDLAEVEANWFAAAFLMPADVFRTFESQPTFRVANHFGVSEAAAKVRARSLGIDLAE
jgi:predicted transcriptional regulator